MTQTDKQTHAPTPWEHTSLDMVCPSLFVRGFGVIARMAGQEDHAITQANARRIVAAVNACEGLSTEALEAGVVADLLAALEAVERLIPQGWPYNVHLSVLHNSRHKEKGLEQCDPP